MRNVIGSSCRGRLFVPREDVADRVTVEATQQNIEVVRIPESELLIFIGEAREGFAERFAPHYLRLAAEISGFRA